MITWVQYYKHNRLKYLNLNFEVREQTYQLIYINKTQDKLKTFTLLTLIM